MCRSKSGELRRKFLAAVLNTTANKDSSSVVAWKGRSVDKKEMNFILTGGMVCGDFVDLYIRLIQVRSSSMVCMHEH